MNHGLSGERVPPTSLVELPPLIPDRNRVVLADHSFGLDGEDPVQITAPAAVECRATLDGDQAAPLIAETRIAGGNRGPMYCFAKGVKSNAGRIALPQNRWRN